MSERKAINKYYPPDYNPLEAERAARRASKNLKTIRKDATTIRLMTPFGMRCLKCSEYIPKSKKFNGKKQILPEKYLDSIKIYRLSIRCPRCNNIIAFRTDPKSSDYVMESGGVRNYVSGKQRELEAEESGKTETVDETLERLSKEDAKQQEEELRGKNYADDKMDLLESRLGALQKQQEDEEELEVLKKRQYRNMQMQEQLANGGELEATQSTKDEVQLEKLAERAFQNRSVKANKVISQEESMLPKMPKVKVKLKSKKKMVTKNPLGIITKQK